MKVLIACEESQTVCKEFRARGHEAYSADIKDCSGGHPEWHIKGNVLPLLNGNCTFMTEGGGMDTHLRRMGYADSTSTMYISDKLCNKGIFVKDDASRKGSAEMV